MSLARRHRDRILAAKNVASAPNDGAGTAPAAAPLPTAGVVNASPAERAAAQIALRYTHDIRRLKEVRSIDKKIEVKREILPEYRAWVAGLIAADAGVGTGVAAEVLPTVMVWLIDTGAYTDALDLVPFMFRHKVTMPSRYQRDAATIVVEEIATAALKAQGADASFPVEILDRVADLTGHLDIHDEVRAKLLKAIGNEQLREAEDLPFDDAMAGYAAAVSTLNEAQRLHERIGVKDKIKRGLKQMAAITAAREKAIADQNNEQGGDTAA
ncbi:phage terminase small subunit [Sphingobium yanoikuyae]|uniref:phage terminase small subunit n=1 Tax=Sphingobium yanoikuyae TaxID=13690 RepID=UPI00240F73B8|nr:phage terminase small subunit [Sphingobium yanoikuyae]MDG2513193.1 phage terminase small subunit [Sphingobium yanoikuyae]